MSEEVLAYVRGNSDRLVRMEGQMTDLTADAKTTASGITRLQEIAEAREKRALIQWELDQKRQLDAETRTADEEAARRAWVRDNWKLWAMGAVAAILLLLFPQIIGPILADGLRSWLGVQEPAQQVMPMPDPVVVPVPIPMSAPDPLPAAPP